MDGARISLDASGGNRRDVSVRWRPQVSRRAADGARVRDHRPGSVVPLFHRRAGSHLSCIATRTVAGVLRGAGLGLDNGRRDPRAPVHHRRKSGGADCVARLYHVGRLGETELLICCLAYGAALRLVVYNSPGKLTVATTAVGEP